MYQLLSVALGIRWGINEMVHGKSLRCLTYNLGAKWFFFCFLPLSNPSQHTLPCLPHQVTLNITLSAQVSIAFPLFPFPFTFLQCSFLFYFLGIHSLRKKLCSFGLRMCYFLWIFPSLYNAQSAGKMLSLLGTSALPVGNILVVSSLMVPVSISSY